MFSEYKGSGFLEGTYLQKCKYVGTDAVTILFPGISVLELLLATVSEVRQKNLGSLKTEPLLNSS